MVQHTDRVDEVEATSFGRCAEGWTQQVALDDLNVVEVGEVLVSRLHGGAQVERDDLARSVLRSELSMAARPAACIEDSFAAEGPRLERMNPIEELPFQLKRELGEVLPLPTDRCGSLRLLVHQVRRDKARNRTADRPAVATPAAHELSRI